jgi:hypothetical protein
MQPQLAAIAREFERAEERAHRLVERTPAERWSLRPAPERWSVAECLGHLNLTAEVYIPMLRDAFSDARFVGAKAPRRYRRDLVGWLLSMAIGPRPYGFTRSKTIAAFVPGADLDKAATMEAFDRLHDELIELTEDAEGRPLQHMKLVSPFNPRATYNAYSCLVILQRHAHRHLWQAEHVWDAD